MIRILLVLSIFMLLPGCGPVLFKVGNVISVTAGDIATVPVKKKVLEEIKQKPNKTAEN